MEKCIPQYMNIILILCGNKNNAPFPWYAFDLVSNTGRAHVVCLVFHAFLTVILKWYFDIYGAANSAQEQGMCNFISQECCRNVVKLFSYEDVEVGW